MSREKQIEEMANIIVDGVIDGEDNNGVPTMNTCVNIAEALYNAGYRKQSGAPDTNVGRKSEWISVEERLPECEYGCETEALLFRLKTGTVEAGYYGTGGKFRDKYFRCYHHANEGWDAKDVTHWMPLPETPKGAGNDA